MKVIFIVLFLLGIENVFLITPIWNLKTTADDLLLNKDSTTILISEGGHKSVVDPVHNTLILEKQITRKITKLFKKTIIR